VLSTREHEVLLLAARGLSNHQMVSRLHVAKATIRRQPASTNEKVGVNSRGQATSKALAEGWITTRDVTEEVEQGTGASSWA
jgi:ATP/maltotriose-dependent transcriptional regulator MalT